MNRANSKQVLWFSPWFPSRIHSTLGNFVERHAKVASKSAEVFVIHYATDSTHSAGVEPLITNGLHGLHMYKPPGLWGWVQLLAMVAGQLRSRRPAIVHLNIFHESWWIAPLARIFSPTSCLVCTEHWTGYHNGNFDKLSRWKKKSIRWAAGFVTEFLPVTYHLGTTIQRAIGRKIPFSVVPNVADERIFTHNPGKKKKYTFLHVSTLDFQHKRPDVILRTFARLASEYPTITMAMGGDGDILPLVQLAKSLGVDASLTFFGEKTEAEVAALMQEVEFLVLYSQYENFPCVIAEAWMCGVPVISSDVGGISEWLKPEVGVLLDADDENKLYEAMKATLTTLTFDPLIIANYGKEHFGTEAVRKKISAVYTQMIDKC